MEKRMLGRTGMNVSVLGFGGSEVGYAETAQESVNQLLNAALDAGLNVIDTAECYKDSESLIGNAVSGRRKDFYLLTKCGHCGKDFGLTDWDPKMLELSIERSLKKLKTDCVDLLHLHSCTLEQLQAGTVLEVAKKAQAAGKTRFVGYSGDGEAAKWAVASGLFDTLQTSCSIADQESIELTIPLAKARGMGVICKRPIANTAWKDAGMIYGGYAKKYWERLQELKYEFIGGPMAAAVSTALRFTLSVPGVTTAIVGTTNPARWAGNAELLKAGKLSKKEFEAIRGRWKAVAQGDWVGQS